MKKFNLKGIKKESVIGVTILLLALINAILQMGGMNVLPITNENLTTVISGIFLVGSAIYSAYTNFNVSTASQTAQKITDAIKNGEVLAEDIEEIIESIKKS